MTKITVKLTGEKFGNLRKLKSGWKFTDARGNVKVFRTKKDFNNYANVKIIPNLLRKGYIKKIV